jgi:hypothetical protein
MGLQHKQASLTLVEAVAVGDADLLKCWARSGTAATRYVQESDDLREPLARLLAGRCVVFDVDC